MPIDLPKEFVIFDLEYTAWEGAQARKWSGQGEYREIVQIGAIMMDGKSLAETDSFSLFVKPRINPVLSAYFTALTGIAQEEVDEKGIDFSAALKRFLSWTKQLPLYSYGNDFAVIEENCRLYGLPSFSDSEKRRFSDVCGVFESYGIPAREYTSGTIVRAFGKEPVHAAHNALNDARTIGEGLRELRTKNQRK